METEGSVGEDGGWGSWTEQLQYMVRGRGGGVGPSWPCSFITTQMDSDESGGFLLVLVVTHTPDGDPVVRPEPGWDGQGLLSRDVRPADGAAGELHVSDQRLDGRLPHQPHEEELRD